MRMRLVTNANKNPVLGISFLDKEDKEEFFEALEKYGERFADPEFITAVQILRKRTIRWKNKEGEWLGVLQGDEATRLLEGLFEATLASDILFEILQEKMRPKT